MATLRTDCPWDRVQTHASLRRHLLEEAYEALEALDRIARLPAAEPGAAAASGSDDAGDDEAWEDLAEELGDVLFQVVFHAHLAAEADRFDLAEVIDGVRAKLVDRHPHIFAGGTHAASDGADWERSKVAEKGRTSVMDGIPASLPALLYATKVVAKADAVAPDTLAPGAGDGPAGEHPDRVDDEAALGRALLEVVVAARAAGLDPEAALRSATSELEARVRARESGQRAPDEP